jgi:hypothetical protein
MDYTQPYGHEVLPNMSFAKLAMVGFDCSYQPYLRVDDFFCPCICSLLY